MSHIHYSPILSVRYPILSSCAIDFFIKLKQFFSRLYHFRAVPVMQKQPLLGGLHRHRKCCALGKRPDTTNGLGNDTPYGRDANLGTQGVETALVGQLTWKLRGTSGTRNHRARLAAFSATNTADKSPIGMMIEGWSMSDRRHLLQERSRITPPTFPDDGSRKIPRDGQR
jgi:hypothetical protein